MNIYEFFPIGSGFIIGSLLVVIPKPYRIISGLHLALFFGLLATFLSAEFKISWAFLFFDVTLVAISAFVGFKTVVFFRLGLAKPKEFI